MGTCEITHRSKSTAIEPAIFVSHTRRRARAVNAAAGLLAVSIALWLVALVGGAADFVALPALRAPLAARPSLRQRVGHTHAPAAVRASVIEATVVRHSVRHRVRREVRS